MYLTCSEIQQLNFLAKKTPNERFSLMAQLIAEQFEAMKAGIKYKNPNIDDKELQECLKNKMMRIYSLRH